VKIVVVCPHFEPDVAPTGEVATRIVEELGRRDHELDVYTSLPWYRGHRIEPGYEGRLVRREDTPWGRITRIHPFPTSDKRNIVRRGAAFVAFSALVAGLGARGGRADAVLAQSPPLTLGLAGYTIARRRKCPFIFNVQDVFPDVAVELGILKNSKLIAAASRLERMTYRLADVITVLSEGMRDNVMEKVVDAAKVRVVPNFVDIDAIKPAPRDNAYRQEFGLTDKFVVMYSGNVGFSMPLEIMIDAAAALSYDERIAFVIHGAGVARPELEKRARGLSNVRFVDMQPVERVPEIYAAADVHVVALKRGLARSSVPSKTYKILAAGRPLLASVDEGSEVARIVEEHEAGVAVPPEDAEAFTKAVARLADASEDARRMGSSGRKWVEQWASPEAVAGSYEELFEELGAHHGGR
jgi:colanic acid biosynthesis glycosyl transferase WcaI